MSIKKHEKDYIHIPKKIFIRICKSIIVIPFYIYFISSLWFSLYIDWNRATLEWYYIGSILSAMIATICMGIFSYLLISKTD